MPAWTGAAAALLSSFLRRCAALSAARAGRQAHSQLLARGLLPHATLETDLLLFYSRCSDLNVARQVFDRMDHRSMHSWNILISSYVQFSLYEQALSVLKVFLGTGRRPDHFTLPPLFKACAGMGNSLLGKQLHGWAVVLGLEDNTVVSSSMLDMYGKTRNLEEAYRLFEVLPERDTVVWNSMISGFARAGLSAEALSLFRSWQCWVEDTDWGAVPSVLNACGREGDLRKGKEVHGRITRRLVLDYDVALGNSLIDMYAKCGSLDNSCRVFANMGDRNLVTWSTLISCYGAHGKGEEALSLFKEMVSQGFKPNFVTFTSVLSSCNHSGLIDDGKSVFDSMRKVYGVEPSLEHYACMVDLMGRYGSIEEALDLLDRMPMEPAASVWGALLAACVVHKNVEIGELSAYKLFELEADNPSNYIALCSIYDAVGDTDGVSKMRARMRELGMTKTPGSSWFVMKGRVHTFYQGDTSHPFLEKIHEALDALLRMMVFSSSPEFKCLASDCFSYCNGVSNSANCMMDRS